MNEKVEDSIKDAQEAFKDAVEFHSDLIGTIQKSHLVATQAILAGYTEVVQKAIDRCDAPAERKASSKK
jgi:hypothetical protein